MPIKPSTKRTILNALKSAVRSEASIKIQRDNLIARAVEAGIPQMEVAKAAGMSQAHVSRTLAANRKANEARKATRAAKAKNEGGTV